MPDQRVSLEAELKRIDDCISALNGIALPAIKAQWDALRVAPTTPNTARAIDGLNGFVDSWNLNGKKIRGAWQAVTDLLAALPTPPKVIPPDGITLDDGRVVRLTDKGATIDGVLAGAPPWGKLNAIWYGTPTGKSKKELWPQGDSLSWYLATPDLKSLQGPVSGPPKGADEMMLHAAANPIKLPPVVTQPPITPPQTAGDPGRYVLFHEDNANAFFAHAGGFVLWANQPIPPGVPAPQQTPVGDWVDRLGVKQGSTHYASKVIAGLGQVSIDVTQLVKDSMLQSDANTGFFLKCASGSVTFWSRSGTVPPKLVVNTSAGTVPLDAIADTYIDTTSNNLGQSSALVPQPALIKFDFSTLTGTVVSAFLNLECTQFGGAVTVNVDKIDMPLLIDNPSQQGFTVQQGLAAEVANEVAVATHPDILVYTTPRGTSGTKNQNRSDLLASFYVNPAFDYISISAGGDEYGDWTDLGVGFLRAWARADGDVVVNNDPSQPPGGYGGNSTITRLDRWFQGPDSASGPVNAAWKRSWASGQSLGYDEMYMRMYIVPGTDIKDGMTELGIKMFTTNGRYEWGAFTPGIPALSDAEKFEYMLWHSPMLAGNNGIYRLCTYDYDVGHSFAAFPSNGEIRPTQGFMRHGKRYMLEQRVKLNTIVGGVPQLNGIHQVWLDSCLVYSDTTRKIRNLPHVQIQGTQGQFYHGGLGKPSKKFHYDVGAIAVSTRYIGAAPSPIPDYVPSPGFYKEFTLNTPQDIKPDTMDTVAGPIDNYGSADFVEDFGTRGCIGYHSGGEHGTGATDPCGVLGLDLETRRYFWANKAPKRYTMSTGVVTDPNPTDLRGYHIDNADTPAPGSPGAGHSFGFVSWKPGNWGLGGPGLCVAGGTRGGSTARALLGDNQSDASNAYMNAALFDMTQSVRGYASLTAPDALRYGKSVSWGGNLGGACIDRKRQGWWSKPGSFSNTTLAFIKKDGTVIDSPVQWFYNQVFMQHVTRNNQDILVMFYNGGPTDYMAMIDLAQGGQAYTTPPANWNRVDVHPSLAPGHAHPPCWSDPSHDYGGGSFGDNNLYIGYGGPRWSQVTDDCFYVLDFVVATVDIWRLRPSNPDNLMGSTWAWSVETVASQDGSVIIPNNGAAAGETDLASKNGPNGKLIEVPFLRSFVWTRAQHHKGQLIRPSWLA